MRRFNGVSLQAVGDQGKKECWRKLRNETLTKVGQKLSEEEAKQLAETYPDVIQFFKAIYSKWIQMIVKKQTKKVSLRLFGKVDEKLSEKVGNEIAKVKVRHIE